MAYSGTTKARHLQTRHPESRRLIIDKLVEDAATSQVCGDTYDALFRHLRSQAALDKAAGNELAAEIFNEEAARMADARDEYYDDAEDYRLHAIDLDIAWGTNLVAHIT